MPKSETQETQRNNLPFEWRINKLNDVASITLGQSPPSSTYNDEGIGPAFLQGKAEFGDVFPSPVKWCSKPQRIAKKDSVLISVRAPVGDVNIAKDDYCIGRGLASICGNERLDNWYLFYYLKHAKKRLEARGTGSTFKSINKGILQEFLISLPPLQEQRAIAQVLSTVRQAIDATEGVIAAARELKRSMMRHLFTYGPVPVGQADQVPLKETEVGEIPDTWEVLSLGEFTETTSGGTPSRKRPEFFNGDIPWIKSGELNDSIVHFFEESISKEALSKSSAKLFPKGTLLLAMYGATAGKVGILDIEATTNQAVCAIFPDKRAFEGYLFYSLIFRRDEILNERYGGAQPNLSQRVIRTFPVPIPPSVEQKEIAKILSTIDTKINVETWKKSALEKVFDSLLHHLMTGKVRVPRNYDIKSN